MRILVPIDGSDCSFRALEFAVEFADRYDGSLRVVHFSEHEDEATATVVERAEAVLADAHSHVSPEVVDDVELSDPRYADRIGKEILRLVDEGGYDHVVMGHHGKGTVGRIILGSAAETVIEGAETPVTVVP